MERLSCYRGGRRLSRSHRGLIVFGEFHGFASCLDLRASAFLSAIIEVSKPEFKKLTCLMMKETKLKRASRVRRVRRDLGKTRAPRSDEARVVYNDNKTLENDKPLHCSFKPVRDLTST